MTWIAAVGARPDRTVHDLGAGFYDTRISPERAKRNHIRQLEALGYKVTLEPAATELPAPRRSDPGLARTLPRACSSRIFGGRPRMWWALRTGPWLAE
jgi:hypothetical protein